MTFEDQRTIDKGWQTIKFTVKGLSNVPLVHMLCDLAFWGCVMHHRALHHVPSAFAAGRNHNFLVFRIILLRLKYFFLEFLEKEKIYSPCKTQRA